MPAAKASLPERRPSFFKSKVREWWDSILAAPSDQEPVSDIVDQEEPKRLTEQLNTVIESVFCSDDAKKLTSIVLDWAKHIDDTHVKDTLRPLLRNCDRHGNARYLRKVLLNFFLALPDPWRTRASSILSAPTVKTSG
jgi:hypothetical protein